MGGNAADVTPWDNFDIFWISRVPFRQACLPRWHLLQTVCHGAAEQRSDQRMPNALNVGMGVGPMCVVCSVVIQPFENNAVCVFIKQEHL